MTLSPDLQGEILSTWKIKRRQTLTAYIIIGAIVGMDYSVILSTLYLYLRDRIGSETPEMYYGVIVAVYSISSTVFGIISGRLVDKTRRMRAYVNIIFIIQIMGSIIYVIPYSVIYPIVARLLAGVCDPFVNVCSGEVIRIYNDRDGTRALWYLASTYSIGFIIGPGLSILFKPISFKIGGLYIDKLNFVGFFMALLSIIAIIISNTLIHDCSAEFDLKEYTKQNNGYNKKVNFDFIEENDGDESVTKYDGDSTNQITENEILLMNKEGPALKQISFCGVIRGLGSNFDAVLLFTSTFVFMFCLFGTDLLIPLLVDITFNWNHVIISYIFIAYGVCYFFLLIIMAALVTSQRSAYFVTIFSIICQILQYIMLIVIASSRRDDVRDSVCLVFFLLFWLVGWCIEEVLLRSMVGKLVPSSVQSFTETLRSGLARTSTIIVSFLVPVILTYMVWYSIVAMVIIIALLICFLARRKNLMYPVEIKFDCY